MNKHIDARLRAQIQIGLAKGAIAIAIVQITGYSPSTSYREIARNKGGAGYDAGFAH